MNGRVFLIGVWLPILAGCYSSMTPLAYTTASIADVKQGQDCTVGIFGLRGHGPDVTLTEAIRMGGITKVRSAEYRVSTFQGIGTECVIVHGE